MMKRFRRNEEGATTLEYALVASLVFLVISGAIFSLSTVMKTQYTTISDTYAGAVAANASR